MVLYVLKDIEDLLDNMDYAKFILYKIVELNGKSYVWIRAGCLAFKGEVSKETAEKLKNKIEAMKRLGKNIIEFDTVIRDDQFYVGG